MSAMRYFKATNTMTVVKLGKSSDGEQIGIPHFNSFMFVNSPKTIGSILFKFSGIPSYNCNLSTSINEGFLMGTFQ